MQRKGKNTRGTLTGRFLISAVREKGAMRVVDPLKTTEYENHVRNERKKYENKRKERKRQEKRGRLRASEKSHGKNGSVCKTSSPTTDQVMNSSNALHRATNWLTACHHPIYGGSVS